MSERDDLENLIPSTPPGAEPQGPEPEAAEAATPHRLTTSALAGNVLTIRQAKQQLIATGAVFQAKHPQLFDALNRNRDDVISFLRELGLSMSIDLNYGLALLRMPYDPESDDEPVPHPLIRRQTLNITESLLAIVLREYYREREMLGDITIHIETETIRTKMGHYLRGAEKSDQLFEKKVSGAIERFRKFLILQKIRGEDDMYEITPVIRVVIDGDWLEGLIQEYRAVLGDEQDAPADRPENVSDDHEATPDGEPA